jgi:hypothetical protein
MKCAVVLPSRDLCPKDAIAIVNRVPLCPEHVEELRVVGYVPSRYDTKHNPLPKKRRKKK